MHTFSKSKHVIVILTIIAMVFSLAIPVMNNTVSAADDPILITVKLNGEVKETYTQSDIDGMTKTTYDYSTYNSYPTYEKKTDVSGVLVEDLISGAGIDITSIDPKHRIDFVSGDKYKNLVSLTGTQLFDEQRYYYPNGATDTVDGKKGSSVSQSDSELVEAMICIGNNDRRLIFGQKLPNEQTKEAWNKYVADGGEINVTTEDALSLNKVSMTPGSSTVQWGSVINLVHDQFRPVNKHVVIYYSADGSNPKLTPSDVYNYGTSGRTASRIINVPAKPGTFTVKAYATRYGWLDSDVSEVSYPTIISTAKGAKATAVDYKSVKISWNAVGGANGYYIYRSTSSNGTYTKYKTVTGTTYSDLNLKTGRTYYYKISAYNGNMEGAASAVVSAKPVLKKPTGVKVKTKGKKKLIITSKKVAGASGYVIYRSTKKSSGFKKIKTVKKSTLKYTDKKVKSKKKYYYKVKAYRNVDGKKVYSPYSSRVSKRAK